MWRCGHHHPDKPPDFLAVVPILTIDKCLIAAGMSADAVWHYHRRVCPPPAAPAREASAMVPATAAVAHLRAMANAGDVRSQVAFGWWLERGDGITKDAAEEIRYFRLAADRGDAIALVALGDSCFAVPELYWMPGRRLATSGVRLSSVRRRVKSVLRTASCTASRATRTRPADLLDTL
jgi:TPR repeat protein